MKILINEIEELTIPCMNSGTGMLTARMYHDGKYRFIAASVHPGGSIGLHAHPSGDDINYILSGSGKAVYDGREE